MWNIHRLCFLHFTDFSICQFLAIGLLEGTFLYVWWHMYAFLLSVFLSEFQYTKYSPLVEIQIFMFTPFYTWLLLIEEFHLVPSLQHAFLPLYLAWLGLSCSQDLLCGFTTFLVVTLGLRMSWVVVEAWHVGSCSRPKVESCPLHCKAES